MLYDDYTQLLAGIQEAESAPSSAGFILNINKVCLNKKVIAIFNKNTGKVRLIDPQEQKLFKLRKRIFAYAETTFCQQAVLGAYYLLIQLSYADNSKWQAKQITKFIQETIEYLGKCNVYDYAWVMEIKPIGRNIHYHLALHCKDRSRIPFPDSSGNWPFGSSNLYAGVSNPYYLCKYTSKAEQKFGDEIPRGARTYGVWLNRDKYDSDSLWKVRQSAYPYWLIKKIDELNLRNSEIRRQDGGGWSINPKDKMSDLYGLNIAFKSPYEVYMGKQQIETYLSWKMGAVNEK